MAREGSRLPLPGDDPHRRLNPLTGEWVFVSPQRTARPWLGQVEAAPPAPRVSHDPDCALCPGNLRARGARNPDYEHVYVFDNDFPALGPPEGTSSAAAAPRPEPAAARARAASPERGLLRAVPVRGVSRVICFSPRHDLDLADMSPAEIRHVVDAWAEETRALGGLPFVRHVQIFENRGAMMGASNLHPHGQIWATEQIPNEPAKEDRAQREYWEEHGRPLLVDYLAREAESGERLVCANGAWAVLVPFWAVWPFETLLLPRRPAAALPELAGAERDALAEILHELTARYDALFRTPFPYSMGWHQAPCDGEEHPGWVLHAHFYPPLLSSATRRKFMVGFEMLSEPQRDTTPEAAAAELRALSPGRDRAR